MKTQTIQTNRLLALIASLGLVACGTSIANAQLINGNLDVTYQQEIVPLFFLPKPASWINEGSRTVTGPYEDEMSSEPWSGPAPTPVTTDGIGADDWGVFFKPFSGNLTTGDLATGRLYQDVSATPGLNYQLTGWAGAEANYSGLIPLSVTKSEFRLTFFDAGSIQLGGAALDLVAAGLGVANGEPFNYKQFSLSAIAPAGTATVRAEVAMIDAYGNPAGGGQAFVVDDFVLSVPEPTTIALFGLGLVGLFGVRRRN